MRTSITFMTLLCLLLLACAESNSTDSRQSRRTERMVAEADRQTGDPAIINFTERKLARKLLELRDTEGVQTWTYIVDLNGNLHLLFESVGYGLPYSVQFTNPERRIEDLHGGNVTLPQPDPNGLFMPPGLSATMVMAATPDGPKPVYVEPEIIVSPFPLHKE